MQMKIFVYFYKTAVLYELQSCGLLNFRDCGDGYKIFFATLSANEIMIK